MLFALGYIAGLVTATLIVATIVFLRAPVERRIQQVQTAVQLAGPRPKGYIFEPEDEAAEVRREHVQRNAERGRDTPIGELQ